MYISESFDIIKSDLKSQLVGVLILPLKVIPTLVTGY